VLVRQLRRVRNNPGLLILTQTMPITMLLFFGYVFGSALAMPGGEYRSFLVPGLLVATAAAARLNTACREGSSGRAEARADLGGVHATGVAYGVAGPGNVSRARPTHLDRAACRGDDGQDAARHRAAKGSVPAEQRTAQSAQRREQRDAADPRAPVTALLLGGVTRGQLAHQ
jgi:hypothetical protein